MASFTVATWNVNSLRKRWEHVQKWLSDKKPDLLAVQETKVTDELFPTDLVHASGYEVIFHGQKSYNGVAILSRSSPIETQVGIPGFDDAQCRVLLARFDDPPVALLNLYVPQGSALTSDKYQYKLNWLDAVLSYVQELVDKQHHLIVLGDLNIAPADIDVHDPKLWEGCVSVSPEERDRFEALLRTGLVDCFRACHPDKQSFSWWDYRGGSYRTNKGLRIDHILAHPALDCQECQIDAEPRGWSQPSDHAPVHATLNY